MRELIRAYIAKPWPKLEIPRMEKRHYVFLALYMIAVIALGWYFYLHAPRAWKFYWLGFAIPILILLKSNFLAIAGLLAFEVVAAFLTVGNNYFIMPYIFLLIFTMFAFENPILTYLLLIEALWFGAWFYSLATTNTMKFVIGIGLLIGWLFKEKISAKDDKPAAPIHFPEKTPLIAFYLWTVVGFLLWCPQRFPGGWMQLSTMTLGVLMCLISPLVVRTEKQLNYVLWAWIIGSIGVAIGIGIAAASPPEGYETSSEGVEWLLAYKNVTAAMLGYAIFIVLAAIFWFKRTLWKVGATMIFLLILIRIIFLGSRGAMAGSAVGFLIFWVVDTFKSYQTRTTLNKVVRMFAIFCPVALFIAALLLFDIEQLLGTYSAIFSPFGEAGSMAFRISTWEIVYEIIKESHHLFRGLGYAAFWVYGPEHGFVVKDYSENIALASPHNLWLDIILHYGLIGLGLFLTMIVINLVQLWKMYRRSSNTKFRYLSLALFCGLIACYIHGGIDGQLSPMVDFWLYLGLIIAVSNVAWLKFKQDNDSSSLTQE